MADKEKAHAYTWEELDEWKKHVEKHKYLPSREEFAPRASEEKPEPDKVSDIMRVLSEMCTTAKESYPIIFDDEAKRMRFEEWAWANACLQALHRWLEQTEVVLASVEKYNEKEYASALLEMAGLTRKEEKETKKA